MRTLPGWLGLLLSLVLPAAGSRAAETSFPPRTLRGFGTAAGEGAASEDRACFTIRAASPEAAELWQAKYISDLLHTTGTVTPVRLPGPGGEYHAYELPDGAGYVASVRAGAALTLAYGVDPARLLSGLPAPTLDNTATDATVPMYLDSWDRYAFRFYYRPESYPPWVKTLDERMAYDPKTEFDYAARHGGLGFVFWTEGHNADLAAGMSNAGQWRWGYELARRRKLPIVLNTMMANPGWITNAFREENLGRMPQYSGSHRSVAEPGHGGMGFTSWTGDRARRAELQLLQEVLRRYDRDSVIEILEPHGELHHGDSTTFQEYGPVADTSFREYLALKHGGTPEDYADRRVPELARFAGWNERAQDLSGEWRIGYLMPKDGPAKSVNVGGADSGWRVEVEEDPTLYDPATDDADWPRIGQMPGTDEAMFIHKAPAVLRRHFTWDGLVAAGQRTWLQLWDLNRADNDFVEVYLNGHNVGRSELYRVPTLHRDAFEVTDFLVPGDNLLALRVPKGVIGYRVYLTPDEPKSYPYLSRELNAEWVDFSGWLAWSRARAVEMGVAAIREIDPDRSIVSMSPDRFFNQLREIARRYGAHFHNTGYMTGIHAEMLPMLMRGADLPFSLEPSGPSANVTDFKKSVGLWLVSGVNAVHYFIHVGNILWDDEIRAYFEKVLPALQQLGRQRQEKADVAMLMDSDVVIARGYPWIFDPEAGLMSGYWGPWRINHGLERDYNVDGLIPGDFAPGGLADPYKVVFDTNTVVMSPELVASIRGWVERGGIFVAMTQSGRHSPEEADTWPIASLTGFRHERFTHYDRRNNAGPHDFLTPDSEQTIFDPALFSERYRGEGVRLFPEAPDAEPLWNWSQGGAAVGMRRLGKGAVFTFGISAPTHVEDNRQLILGILRWAGARPRPMTVDAPLIPRHFVSGNGLYDVWAVWNPTHDKTLSYAMRFLDGRERPFVDLLTGRPAEPRGELPPFEFALLASPRFDPALSPSRWFSYLRDRWQGAEKPPFAIAGPELDHARNYTLPLDQNWLRRPLAEDGDPVAALAENDGWETVELGPWLRDEEVEGDRFILKREITLPPHWRKGQLQFWLTANYDTGSMFGQAKLFLNGEPWTQLGGNYGTYGLPLTPPDDARTFTLGMELKNRNARIYGVRGATFLSFIPDPDREVDLAGVWTAREKLVDPEGTPVAIPGAWTGAGLRRSVELPDRPEGGRVFLYWEGDRDLAGVIFNGRHVRRHHHNMGEATWLDVTPWAKPGAVNDVILPAGNHPHKLRTIKLYLYDRPVFGSDE